MRDKVTMICTLTLILLLGIMIGSAVASEVTAIQWVVPIFTGITSMLAVFLGAKYAFVLTERRERAQQRKEEANSGNRVIFNFVRIRNNLMTLKKQVINPHKDNPARAYYILPTSSLGSFENIGFSDAFLFSHSSEPMIVNELVNLQMEIVTTLECIEQRTDTHMSLQEKLDAANISLDKQPSLKEMQDVVGARLLAQLTNLTDAMIDSVDDIIKRCDSLIPKLTGILKEKYPEQNVLSMQ